jgi:hypothetical protein
LRKQKRIEILNSKRLKFDIHPSQFQSFMIRPDDNPIDSICAKIQISIQNGHQVIPDLTALRQLLSNETYLDSIGSDFTKSSHVISTILSL